VDDIFFCSEGLTPSTLVGGCLRAATADVASLALDAPLGMFVEWCLAGGMAPFITLRSTLAIVLLRLAPSLHFCSGHDPRSIPVHRVMV
jgi:hypothetical protein